MNHLIEYKSNSSLIRLDDIISVTNTGRLPLVRTRNTSKGGSITKFTIWPSPRWPFSYVAGEIHQNKDESSLLAKVLLVQPVSILEQILLNKFVMVISFLLFSISIIIIANPKVTSGTLEGKYIEWCYLFIGFFLSIYPAIYLIRMNNHNLFRKIYGKLGQLHGK